MLVRSLNVALCNHAACLPDSQAIEGQSKQERPANINSISVRARLRGLRAFQRASASG